MSSLERHVRLDLAKRVYIKAEEGGREGIFFWRSVWRVSFWSLSFVFTVQQPSSAQLSPSLHPVNRPSLIIRPLREMTAKSNMLVDEYKTLIKQANEYYKELKGEEPPKFVGKNFKIIVRALKKYNKEAAGKKKAAEAEKKKAAAAKKKASAFFDKIVTNYNYAYKRVKARVDNNQADKSVDKDIEDIINNMPKNPLTADYENATIDLKNIYNTINRDIKAAYNDKSIDRKAKDQLNDEGDLNDEGGEGDLNDEGGEGDLNYEGGEGDLNDEADLNNEADPMETN